MIAILPPRTKSCPPMCRCHLPGLPSKNGPDDKGGIGRAGRRKARGWRKGWAKQYRKLTGLTDIGQVGSFNTTTRAGMPADK